MSASEDPEPWTKLGRRDIAGPEQLVSLSLEDLLSTCQLTSAELDALQAQLAERGLAFRSAPVRYPFLSPLLLREVGDAGIDVARASISTIGLPVWAERPLLAAGIRTVDQLARASTFQVRTALGLGGRPQTLLRQQVEEYLLGMVRAARRASPPERGDVLLRHLPLGPRTLGALRRAGIFTLDQLRRLPEADLARLPGLGPARLAEIRSVVPGDAPASGPATDNALHAEAVSVRPEAAARPVAVLPLPQGILQRLEASRISTIGDLVAAGEERLDAIPRLGPASVRRVRQELERYLLTELEDVGGGVPEIVAEVQADAAASTLDERLADLIGRLRSPRLVRLMAWRFGLDGRIRTLEQVGRELGVSKQRVRQLERAALEQLRRDYPARVEGLSRPPREALAAVGGVAPFSYMLDQLPVMFPLERLAPPGAARLLLELSDDLEVLPGRRAALRGARVRDIERLDEAMVTYLRRRMEPTPVAALTAVLAQGSAYPEIVKRYPSFSLAARTRANTLVSVLPSGEIGLKEWTRNRLDDAVRALRRLGEPSHYREIALEVQEHLPESVSVSTEGVHNLLLDEAAFVRTGRGVFGLAEWQEASSGLAPRIAEILGAASEPLHRSEIARALGLGEREVERTLLREPAFDPAGRGYYKLAGREYAPRAVAHRTGTTARVGTGGCVRIRVTPATHRSGTLALGAALRSALPEEGDLGVAWPGSAAPEVSHMLHRGRAHLSGLGGFLRAEMVAPGDAIYIERRADREPSYALYTEAQWRAATSTNADSRSSAASPDG